MFTKLFPAAVLAFALVQAACSQSTSPSTPSTGVPVTETFTGTLTLNGADTIPFSVSRSGSVSASIASLAPDATITVGLSLGTWNGTACATVISNDAATVGTTVTGSADREGRLCVRVYDAAGTLPQPTDFQLAVVHP